MRDTPDKSLERRLKRIERWLRRCMAACRCGSWSSALMEVECMEAETQGFRDDLWKTVVAEANGAPSRPAISKVFFAARVAAISLVFVLAVGLPLSMDQDRPFQPFDMGAVALLTSTENEILSALRHSLSNANEGRILLSVEMPEERREAPTAPGVAMAEDARAEEIPAARPVPPRSVRSLPQRPRVEVVAAETPQKREGPSVEEVLSLIQVGERALRISEPAVRGIP